MNPHGIHCRQVEISTVYFFSLTSRGKLVGTYIRKNNTIITHWTTNWLGFNKKKIGFFRTIVFVYNSFQSITRIIIKLLSREFYSGFGIWSEQKHAEQNLYSILCATHVQQWRSIETHGRYPAGNPSAKNNDQCRGCQVSDEYCITVDLGRLYIFVRAIKKISHK